MKLPSPHSSDRAFSLIEVVLALGICAFALISILSLFSVGVKSVGEAGSELQAANLASLIVAQRRADPTNPTLVAALPILDQALQGNVTDVKVGWDGLPATGTTQPAYLLRYRVGLTNTPVGGSTGNNTKTSLVYVALSWPPTAAFNSPGASHYELITQVQIP